MKRLIGVIVIGSIFVASIVWAAGTATYTLKKRTNTGPVSIFDVAWVWTGSTGDGSVVDKSTSETIHGWLLRGCTTISASATDNYDITIDNASGHPVTGTDLANRDTTTSECVNFTRPIRVDSTMTLNLDNNSDTSSGGTVNITIEVD